MHANHSSYEWSSDMIQVWYRTQKRSSLNHFHYVWLSESSQRHDGSLQRMQIKWVCTNARILCLVNCQIKCFNLWMSNKENFGACFQIYETYHFSKVIQSQILPTPIPKALQGKIMLIMLTLIVPENVYVECILIFNPLKSSIPLL